MYATKEKGRDEPSSRSDNKEEAAAHTQDGRENIITHNFLIWTVADYLINYSTVTLAFWVMWFQTAAYQIYTWKWWMGMQSTQEGSRPARRPYQVRTKSVSGLARRDTIHPPWDLQDPPHLTLVPFIRYRCYHTYPWCGLLPSSTLMWFNECWRRVSSPSNLDLLLCKQVSLFLHTQISCKM